MDSKSLRALRLSANLIRVLPEKIGEMRRLRELCLDFNRLAVRRRWPAWKCCH